MCVRASIVPFETGSFPSRGSLWLALAIGVGLCVSSIYIILSVCLLLLSVCLLSMLYFQGFTVAANKQANRMQKTVLLPLSICALTRSYRGARLSCSSAGLRAPPDTPGPATALMGRITAVRPRAHPEPSMHTAGPANHLGLLVRSNCPWCIGGH